MIYALVEISLTKLSHIAIDLDVWESRFGPFIKSGLTLLWNLSALVAVSMRRKGVELYHG
jgi:hypothetical protein